jgi:hypothetical protein
MHRSSSLRKKTEHVMVSLQSFRNSILSTFGLQRAAPDLDGLRGLCAELLDDVPAADRKGMLQRLETLRRADDVWHLRSALFDTIARAHGEAEARERLVVLDEKLR